MDGVHRCKASILNTLHCVKDGRRYIWVNKSKQNKGRGKSPKHFNTKTEHGDAAKKQRRRGANIWARRRCPIFNTLD